MSPSPSPEKRRAPRVQPYIVACRMELPNGRLLSGYLTDLGPLGAQVSCDGPPPAAGIRVAIDVHPRQGPAWPRLKAEVKWTRPPAHGGDNPVCGLTFVEVDAAARALIEAVLDDFRQRAEQLGQGRP